MRARVLGVLGCLCAAGACREPPAPVVKADTAALVATTSASSAVPRDATDAAGASAPKRSALSPEAARALAKRASGCLVDPRCRREEAARLSAEAVEADAIHPGCFDLYYGIDVAADATRARACFEREVAREKPCDGASPSLARTFLGLMLLDAQGGARESARGEALFAGCLSGGAVVVGAAEAREKSGATKPTDFCADLGGTTLDQTECARIDADRGAAEARKAVKDLFASITVDDEGFALWSRAGDAWSRFSSRDAAYARDLWRDGTGAPTVYESTLAAHERERPEVLRALLAPASSPDRPGEAEGALKRAEASAGAGADDARKKLLADAEAAFRAYRAAEAAFVGRAFAARHGSARAAAQAAEAALSRRRAAALGKAD